ncbi:hypothetical protein ACFQQB_57210 [Nonomuraea rubra]
MVTRVEGADRLVADQQPGATAIARTTQEAIVVNLDGLGWSAVEIR